MTAVKQPYNVHPEQRLVTRLYIYTHKIVQMGRQRYTTVHIHTRNEMPDSKVKCLKAEKVHYFAGTTASKSVVV
jgi:hypothetical protein